MHQVTQEKAKDEVAHGQGTAKYADGSVYSGEWRYGKVFGQGTYTTKYKEWTPTWWAFGMLLGLGYYKNVEAEYTGTMMSGQKNGKGLLTLSDGHSTQKIEGVWINDKLNGKATVTNNVGTKKQKSKDVIYENGEVAQELDNSLFTKKNLLNLGLTLAFLGCLNKSNPENCKEGEKPEVFKLGALALLAYNCKEAFSSD